MISTGLKRLKRMMLRTLLQSAEARTQLSTEGQIVLRLTYRRMLQQGQDLPTFEDVGFSVYSQSNEDGILLYIFSLIGSTNRRLVDIGCGGVDRSNSANLLLNHGWTGVLIDSDKASMTEAKSFYSHSRGTCLWPPVTLREFVTAENINDLLIRAGVSGEIDLLCIDVDGMDWWIWKALDVVDARVVVVEYQDILGPEKSVTVPYNPNFQYSDAVHRAYPDYFGASLPAFVKLARQKSYRLVGCNQLGYNAFFVRAGLGDPCLPEVPPAACFRHPKTRFGQDIRAARIRDLHWVEV